MQIYPKKSSAEIFKNNKLPILLYAGQISDEPTWRFPAHSHDNLSEIIYVKEGEGDFIVDNVLYRAKKGDILVYNKSVVHDEKSDPEKPLRTYFCGISNLFLKDCEEGCLIPAGVKPIINADKYSYKVESYISSIFEECYSQIMGYETICQNLIISLIILIKRIMNTDIGLREEPDMTILGTKIKEYIDKNYTKDISINDIANSLYISRHYLSHVFKDDTGTSPVNYIIDRRIGQARKLLLTTNKTIQQISYDVGYENTNYFSMLFKRKTGITPGEFRKENTK